MSKRQKGIAAPTILPLSYNDLRFINEFEARLFQSPGHIDAYLAIHPGCKRESARVSAERILQKPTVRAEIQSRLEASRSVNVETLGACLHRYRQLAEEKGDYVAGASIVMDQAKLGGLLVEKHEDVGKTAVSKDDAISELYRRGLMAIPAN